MTPTARESCDAMIRLNAFAAFRTASVTIAFDPVMKKFRSAADASTAFIVDSATSAVVTSGRLLPRALRFHVGGDAGGRCVLDAALVNSVFAYCGRTLLNDNVHPVRSASCSQ